MYTRKKTFNESKIEIKEKKPLMCWKKKRKDLSDWLQHPEILKDKFNLIIKTSVWQTKQTRESKTKGLYAKSNDKWQIGKDMYCTKDLLSIKYKVFQQIWKKNKKG